MQGWGVAEWSAVVAAAAAAVNVVLVLVLVGATIYYARQTKATVSELREARIGSYLPYLLWQTPKARVHHELTTRDGEQVTKQVWMTVEVVLWNIGPGAARVLAAKAHSEAGDPYEWPTLGVPSTIPAGNETAQLLIRKVFPHVFEPALANLIITVKHADVFERRTYETRIKIAAHFENSPPAFPPQLVDVPAAFLDSDERSAQGRRVG